MPRAKILIVDDEVIIARMLELMLTDMGYSIAAQAHSGEEALEKAAETLPDLALMDINLPGKLDGIETAAHLQRVHDVPIVYLSAHCSDTILERAKITAPFGYVMKPIKEKELYAAIEIALYKHQLEERSREMNDELERRVAERTLALQQSNQALQDSMETLHRTLLQLAQAEKMAVIGGLVAGMTHEISNPLSIAVMAVSHLDDLTQKTQQEFLLSKLTRSSMEKFFENAKESVAILEKNLYRTAELLNSLKQMAIDRASESKKEFLLARYIDDILLSLKPTLKTTQHTITVECPDDLLIDSYPGVFSQIFTNLIMNSLIHGFETKPNGQIHIRVRHEGGLLFMQYHDNGRGIPEEHLGKLFHLFFTTKREQGGNGLGLNIIHNLITQKLGGRISCESVVGEGTTFLIHIPL